MRQQQIPRKLTERVIRWLGIWSWSLGLLWGSLLVARAAEPLNPPDNQPSHLPDSQPPTPLDTQPSNPSGSQPSPPNPPESKHSSAHVVLVAYEDEYEAARTLRDFARLLHQRYGCRTTLLVGEPEKDLPGLNVLDQADLVVLYVRRKALPADQMKRIRQYVESGKPLVALRTSSHAFTLRPGSPATPKQQWPEFDAEVLGGNYHGHTGKQYPPPEIFIAPEAQQHPIVAGIEPKKWQSGGSLYLVSPIDPKATVLLWGQTGPYKEPVAWVRTYRGGRVFYTSLGHPDDFDHSAAFVRLLVQAVFWAMNRPVPSPKRP